MARLCVIVDLALVVLSLDLDQAFQTHSHETWDDSEPYLTTRPKNPFSFLVFVCVRLHVLAHCC